MGISGNPLPSSTSRPPASATVFSQITLVGLSDGHELKVFVGGINLDAFAAEVQRYRLPVTFNGKRFDLLFPKQTFGELPSHLGHPDLRYPLRRLGYPRRAQADRATGGHRARRGT